MQDRHETIDPKECSIQCLTPPVYTGAASGLGRQISSDPKTPGGPSTIAEEAVDQLQENEKLVAGKLKDCGSAFPWIRIILLHGSSASKINRIRKQYPALCNTVRILFSLLSLVSCLHTVADPDPLGPG